MKKSKIEKVIASIVLLTGTANIWFALFFSFPKRFDLLLEIFPLTLLHASRSLMLISGLVMVILASNLWQKKKRAWSILIVLSITSSLLHLIKDWNIYLFLLNGLIFMVLWKFRFLFYVQSESFKKSKALKVASLWLLGVLIYAIFGFFLFSQDFSVPVTLPRIIHDYAYGITGIGREVLIAKTHNAHWFVDSILVVSVFGITSSFSSLFLPYILKSKLSEEDKKIVHDLLMNNSFNSSSYFALSGDKQIFFNRTKSCFLAYKVSQKTAVVLGDPAGKNLYWKGLITEFIEFMNRQGLTVGFVNIEKVGWYKQLGFNSLKIGEEAIIPLGIFSIKDSKMADVRHSVNRMIREGVIYKWHQMNMIPWKDMAAIDALHDQWIKQKNGPSLTFSVDFYPFPIEPNGFVLIAYSPKEKPWAVLSFLPYGNHQLVLEMMLRSNDSPNGVMEAALGKSMLHFKELGYKKISLGLAPLSDVESKKEQKTLDKTRQFVFDHFNQIYNYKSLFRFKRKFQPIWESRYLIYQKNLLLPQIITALVKVHLRDKKVLRSIINKYLA